MITSDNFLGGIAQEILRNFILVNFSIDGRHLLLQVSLLCLFILLGFFIMVVECVKSPDNGSQLSQYALKVL